MSNKTPISKKKNFFVGAGMKIDFLKEDYKKFEKILQKYAISNNWNLEKEKFEKGYSVMIVSYSTTAEEVLNFIENIKYLGKEFEKELGENSFYPDTHTNFKYYGSEEDGENLLLGIHRFSGMMVINIILKNALKLDKEDSEIAQEIFGDYIVDGNKLLNVRVVNDDYYTFDDKNSWIYFWIKFIIFSILFAYFFGLIWGIIIGFVAVIIWNIMWVLIRDLFWR